MNKKLIFSISTVALIVVVGSGYMYNNSQNKKEASALATEKLAMEKKSQPEPTAKVDNVDKMVKPDEVMVKDVAEMTKVSPYVTLADYSKDTEAYKDSKKVYFFHASWCSICQGIDKEITTDPSLIPTGTTFIKTDFDTNTELRQKYGVTTQYTFVQVDNSGNEINQWSAINLNKAVAGIQ